MANTVTIVPLCRQQCNTANLLSFSVINADKYVSDTTITAIILLQTFFLHCYWVREGVKNRGWCQIAGLNSLPYLLAMKLGKLFIQKELEFLFSRVGLIIVLTLQACWGP